MKYAEVAVDSPVSRSTFSYAIPSGVDISVGQAVWVPFGTRVVQGIVAWLSDQPSVTETKEIEAVVTDSPLLSPLQIKLAQWMSERYLASLFDGMALMLPPGFGRRAVDSFELTGSHAEMPLTAEQRQVLGIMGKEKGTSLSELEQAVGRTRARKIIRQLLDQQLIARRLKPERSRAGPRTVAYVRLAADTEELVTEQARLDRARARKQAEILRFLTALAQPVSVGQLSRRLGCSSAAIKALESRGLVSVERLRVRRDPLSRLSVVDSPIPVLTPSQQAAWQSIQESVGGKAERSANPPVFLLFGVTGSGKTEVYLRALASVIVAGKRGICLIPEIALTRQTVERFAGRFAGRVAILHSDLSLGEQFDEWQRIMEGNCDVVIGPRSALFAPVPDLGLIIIDEEHEWTYKQDDRSPRYHAREAAIELARLSDAVVILGSATPDVGTFYRAQQGEYRLVELKERITPRGHSPLPEVTIVDLREELKAGNAGLFSRSLASAIQETLAHREQAILFLNRRGTATFVRCRNCGFVMRCPRCSIALTYHSAEKRLLCHRCRHTVPLSQSCPQCSRRLRFLGIGTQRVEEEMGRLFPEARVLRWDSDAIGKRYGHEALLEDFRNRKADVLVGTQMIAKGLDLPQVTLAGIVSADTGLNFPDFRSGERTFQLLCQVAGRAGRGLKAGRVIIQTYSPDNYAVRAAAGHDYAGFYEQEIAFRRRHSYPPFSLMVRLVYSHIDEKSCRTEVERVHRVILEGMTREEMADLSLIGPAPASGFRVRGRYRWQMLLRGSDPTGSLSRLALPRGWIVDVDPLGLV